MTLRSTSRAALSYVALAESGELHRRVAKAQAMLERCVLCARVCGANRLRDERGDCRSGRWAIVSSFFPHFGEEPPLTGYRGSGTIFFSQCNLACIFCQNFEISHLGQGRPRRPTELAGMMLQLQEWGCHNINLVSPSHVVAQILEALEIAVDHGLRLPLVYNTGGYDAMPALRLLDGVVDVYMPDMKYADANTAARLSGIKSYPQVNRKALKEMHRQVGDLVLDERGIGVRGLLIRHLVLPEHLAGTAETVRWIATELSPDSYVNIMEQYRPCFRAAEVAALRRRITGAEYREALRLAREVGLHRGFPSPAEGW